MILQVINAFANCSIFIINNKYVLFGTKHFDRFIVDVANPQQKHPRMIIICLLDTMH